jgi:hypothetical protein
MRIEAIYIAPVKSLALCRVERARVGPHGIAEDRRFFLVDAAGRVFTQRECGRLATVRATYDGARGRLRFEFPDGAACEGVAAAGEPLAGSFYGREFGGVLAPGTWNDALSALAGQPLRLVRASGTAFDALPVSLCSAASVEEVRRRANGVAVDERRFRPNFYLSSAGPHGEDEWVGRRVRIGREAIVRVVMRDSRCVMTTLNPDTGRANMDTLKLIASYRTDQPNEVNFGVYGTVEREGDVSVGDEIVVMEEGEQS